MAKEVFNSLPIGTILQSSRYNYKVEKVLGQGSFGITYLAKVEHSNSSNTLLHGFHVTIKEFFMRDINGRNESTVTSSSNGGMYNKYKQKFAQEAQNLKKLDHPNIVKVMDFFSGNNTYYYVMDYLCGGSLDQYIESKGRIAENEAIGFIMQIGDAISYMHEKKMLHLDMKPANVMLNADGDAVVIDFGLSKQYNENGEPESSTTVGGGTPGYAPLEQSTHHDGHGFPVTMDVYALGATIYKMLTGVRAPEASSLLNDGFPTTSFANISERTISTIVKAMSPMKRDRYQSVSDFINDFTQKEYIVADTDIEIENTVTDRRKQQKSRRKKDKKTITIEDLIVSGDDAYRRNDYPTALHFYQEAFRRDNSLAEVAYTIGEIFYKGHDTAAKKQKGQGRYASMNDTYNRELKSAKWFRYASDLGYDTSNELLQKADSYFKEKDYKRYFRALEECVLKNYKCKKAISLLFDAYEKSIGCERKRDIYYVGGVGINIIEFLKPNHTNHEIYTIDELRNTLNHGSTAQEIEQENNACTDSSSDVNVLNSIIKESSPNRMKKLLHWFSANKRSSKEEISSSGISKTQNPSENKVQQSDIPSDLSQPEFFSEYEKVRIGDFIYEDGTFSHRKTNARKAIGVVFSLNPCPQDIKRGWTHGYVMALKNIGHGETKWGDDWLDRNKSDFINVSYDEMHQILRKDFKGYDYTYAHSWSAKYIFGLVLKTNLQHASTTSEWFLPSVGHWVDIIQNLTNTQLDNNLDWKEEDNIVSKLGFANLFEKEDNISGHKYWTSNQYDWHSAFVVDFDNKGICAVNKKCLHIKIRCIAAF